MLTKDLTRAMNERQQYYRISYYFKTDCQPNILKAGDCPIGFIKSADTCYFVGRWKKDRTAAKVNCEYS